MDHQSRWSTADTWMRLLNSSAQVSCTAKQLDQNFAHFTSEIAQMGDAGDVKTQVTSKQYQCSTTSLNVETTEWWSTVTINQAMGKLFYKACIISITRYPEILKQGNDAFLSAVCPPNPFPPSHLSFLFWAMAPLSSPPPSSPLSYQRYFAVFEDLSKQWQPGCEIKTRHWTNAALPSLCHPFASIPGSLRILLSIVTLWGKKQLNNPSSTGFVEKVITW